MTEDLIGYNDIINKSMIGVVIGLFFTFANPFMAELTQHIPS